VHDELLFERQFWGDCCNTFSEDQKHYVYSRFMELIPRGYHFEASNKRILDIGGGPTSMLLKCTSLMEGLVVDPLCYPQWTVSRYATKNIRVQVGRGEDVSESGWDEVWIYNCLQHTDDPERIIKNALKAASTLRLFEWIDIPPHDGHPVMLTKNLLDRWIGREGLVCDLNEAGCVGRCYANVYTR
jgi:hypothetical protein